LSRLGDPLRVYASILLLPISSTSWRCWGTQRARQRHLQRSRTI
jgi:hypothetical protein